MPQTSEIAFNFELSNVLRTKHPRWRNRTSAEQTNVLRETGLQPDVVIRPPGGVPVVLETEFEPARTVELDAQKRLGFNLKYAGDPIEQTIAVQIPKDLSHVPQADRQPEPLLELVERSGKGERGIETRALGHFDKLNASMLSVPVWARSVPL